MDSDIDSETIVNEAVENLKVLLFLYKNANVKDKQFIIGSIFPEKWIFSDSKGRTGKINEAVALIYHVNSILHKKITGVIAISCYYSGYVPSAGVIFTHLLVKNQLVTNYL
jgi:hypothetical protein